VRRLFDLKKHGKFMDDIAIVSQLGLTMAGSILFCFAIGYYLDKWLNTKGLFITIFILLGIAGGGYTVYRQIMEVTTRDGEGKQERERRK
jgi:ATP synthase protein I